MKVILTEEVTNVGSPGEVVDVATGYARNYLLPRKLAIEATMGNVKALDHHKRTIESRQKKLAHGAEAVGRRISSAPLTFTTRAGGAGRLYGSITSADIAAELKRAFDVEVDKRKIEIPEPIKVLGEHTVNVRLHRDVRVPVTVAVVAEAAPPEAEPTAAVEGAPAEAESAAAPEPAESEQEQTGPAEPETA